MSLDARREEKFKKRLQRIISSEDLSLQRQLVQRMATECDVDLLDCAAALVYISQPHLFSEAKTQAPQATTGLTPPILSHKTVRYRLAVGSQQQISPEEIQAVLIEESGVDKKQIGRIEIRHNYTLVELPDGMPVDIFQVLTEATIKGHKLCIKRVKPNKFRPNKIAKDSANT